MGIYKVLLKCIGDDQRQIKCYIYQKIDKIKAMESKSMKGWDFVIYDLW